MATATPNILINSIRGKNGNVVFYTRRGVQCVRTHVIPRNPDTEAQRFVRRSFGDAVRSWQAMTPDEKYAYIKKARYLNMSGYNLYISEYLKRVIQAVSRTPTDELKPKVSSLPWNLDLATLHLLPVPERSRGIPSVSKPYTIASGINTYPGHLKLRPG